jgi:pyridoxamine 5'-phosphate oxidase
VAEPVPAPEPQVASAADSSAGVIPAVIVERFHALLERARASGEPEPNAMSLATADARGRPSVRTVLLKQFDQRGFVFYTNTQSDKGRQLAENPQAALCLLWKQLDLQVQVRAEGAITPVDAAEADAYFATRPRGSQIGAWASQQSRPLDRRESLEALIESLERRYAQQPVPRPPHWSGYRLLPDRVEFWSGRPFRLHERVLYARGSEGWHESLLQP